MIAVVNIAGQQFKVSKGQKLFVHRQEAETGSQVNFDQVLMLINGDQTTVGMPTVAGASISAKVLDHVKGDKVIVYKKNRRKGYEKKNGHRQSFTQIQVESIQI
ncbi:MAG: 50S ribosomal protein L21 [Saprospiraceae bacterium]|nr:50S ribosomal protein L21 [Saprospiraceae bacterium]HRG68855.1 50S ribosomal protein L21 [Saprospiraceae bacterium]